MGIMLDVWRQICLQAECTHSPELAGLGIILQSSPIPVAIVFHHRRSLTSIIQAGNSDYPSMQDQQSTTRQQFLLRLITARFFLVCVKKEEVEGRGKWLRAFCTYACEQIDSNLKKRISEGLFSVNDLGNSQELL